MELTSLLKRKKRDDKGTTQVVGRSLLAAAMPLEGPEGKQAWRARSGDDAWQRSAWYHYDATGELRFAFNWMANAISRAVLFGAETDPETGQITGPTEDPRAQAVAATILGGAEERPQLQSTIALQWQVAGESFALIRPTPPQDGVAQPDSWYALSATQVKQRSGKWTFCDPLTGVDTPLDPVTDRLVRIWSPHPNAQTHADSAMRAALPILTEIEKCTQNIAARLDSRLAGNGVLFLPQEIDFPTADGEQADAQSFVKLLLDAAEASLRTPGTAAAQVPITATVPGEQLGNIQHLDLATALDAVITELRQDAVNRLGMTLDMPREVALGQTGEANHWSGWLIEESTYKIHVEPFLLKLGAALTKWYYRPALRAMGVSNPERFVLTWDISEVVARPDQTEMLNGMHDKGLISDDYLRAQNGIPDDAIPDDDEIQLKRLERIVVGAPTLAADGEIARRLFGFEIAPAAAGVADPGAVTEPALDAGPPSNVRALPDRNAAAEPDAGLVAAAELVVYDALSRAGGRLLTRAYRGQFSSTPKTELHTVIPRPADPVTLLEGSFQFVSNVAHAFALSPVGLENALREYVEDRLILGKVHNRALLASHLRTVAVA